MEPDPPAGRVLRVEGALTYPLPADADADVDVASTAPAFPEFYGATRDRIVRAMALTLGNADLACDAVDEAMARAYQRWERVGAFTDPAGWVYRVALNWATSVIRKRDRQRPTVTHDDEVHIAPAAEPDLAAALAELPVHQRAVVVCRFYLGMTEQETAAALRTRPGTVKSRMHRALSHLQTRLAHLSPKEQS